MTFKRVATLSFLLSGMGVLPNAVDAATINAASCSASSVQTAITSASNGDTVAVPGPCTVSWTTGSGVSGSVLIPSNKGITLSGGGNVTLSSSPSIDLEMSTAASSRVTGFIFTGGGTDNYGVLTVCASNVNCNSTYQPFRIDHNTFTNSGGAVFLGVWGLPTGLIDHNTLTAGAAAEMLHISGLGAGSQAGWTNSVTPGSASMVYIESNTFINSSPNATNLKAIESFYGSQTVFRYNTLQNNVALDQHGSPGAVGARWWEFYENTFVLGGYPMVAYATLRAGSGVFFNNHVSGSFSSGTPGVALEEEDSGYPACFQIGRGYNPVGGCADTGNTPNSGNNELLSPAYLWGNDPAIQSSITSVSSNVLSGRDFYVSTNQPTAMMRCELATDSGTTGSCASVYTYSPFTYPYPLDANGLPSPAVVNGGSTTPPTVSVTSPTSGSSVSGTAVTVAATASSNLRVAGVQFQLDGTSLGAQVTAGPYSVIWNTTQTSNGPHSLTAVATDALGKQGTSTAVMVTVNNPDTQPPTTPTNLTATAVSPSQINLSWTASTDNVGVTGYKVFRNASIVGTATATRYSDTGLSPSTTYSYTVSAYDAAGNISSQSAGASATTSTPTQTSGALLPSNRAIDWTTAGIPGGIPSANWPIYRTLSPSGGADDSVAIQTAINSAPVGSVIFLSPGTYKLHRASTVCYGLIDDFASGVYESGLCINKGVVLRGSGPDRTILQYGDGANFISLGNTYLTTASTVFKPITAGGTEGSTQITVQSASGITAGTYITVTQNNPTDSDGNPLVSATGYTGSCSNCGHGFANNVMTQMDKVTAVNGSVLTLERPLYFDYTNSPQFYIQAPMVEYAGLESLRLWPTASSGTGIIFKNINLESCAYCWVHDVESDMAVDRANVYLSDVYASEISNNYLNDAYTHTSGEGYGVMLEFRASANLIQNNIIRKARHSTVMSGGSGNVWGYNYAIDPYMGEDPTSLPDGRGHGAHPYMNLWEGNTMPNFEFDYTHGSSSHNTLFRNYYNLTSTNPSTGNPMTNGLFAVNVAYFNNYLNVIGNAIGEYGSTCTASAYEINANASQAPSIYKLGYYDDGTTVSPNTALSAKVGQTILRGGNWDCTTNSVVWSSNVPSGSLAATYLTQQVLPSSLYLSGAPAWAVASGTGWPVVDPGSSMRVNKTPAQMCYESGPKLGGAYNPTLCYNAVTIQLQAPTSVAASVH